MPDSSTKEIFEVINSCFDGKKSLASATKILGDLLAQTPKSLRRQLFQDLVIHLIEKVSFLV